MHAADAQATGHDPGRVSTVIPSFRRPRELAEAVASVLAQGPLVLEVLVVDDSPEGAAREVVAHVTDPRVRYMHNPRPSGGFAGQVRNIGLSVARGEFLHFLDDDDLLPVGTYERAVAALDARPGIGAVFGRIEPFGELEGLVVHERDFFATAARRARRFAALRWRHLFAAQQTFGVTLLVCSAGMVRRSCAEAVGGFATGLRHMEDVDFYSRVFRRFGGCYVDHTCLRYRIGPSLMREANIMPSVLRAYEAMHGAYRRQWGLHDFLFTKLLARTVLRLA